MLRIGNCHTQRHFQRIQGKRYLPGYEGLITGEIKELTTETVSNIIQRGGTILKTARSQAFMTPEGRKKAYETMQKEHIVALIEVIGGDGSLTGARIFAEEYNVVCIGLPGTIDNDLYGTDYTIGYDTALNTIVECVDKIRTQLPHTTEFSLLKSWDGMPDIWPRTVPSPPEQKLPSYRKTARMPTSWNNLSAADSGKPRTAASSLSRKAPKMEGPCTMQTASKKNTRSMTYGYPFWDTCSGEDLQVHTTVFWQAGWEPEPSKPYWKDSATF